MTARVTVNTETLEIVDRFHGDINGREAPGLVFIEVQEPFNLNTVKAVKTQEGNITLIEDEVLVEYMAGEPERVNARNTRIFKSARNMKLSECDWTQLPNAPLSDSKKQEWEVYRQALRDLPANTADPENPVWPTLPTS
jgi:hypothetical protein